MLQRLGSKIGLAKRWSKSIKIVDTIIIPAIFQFFLNKKYAIIKGTIK
jgi:hypothetical protein